MSQRKRKRGRGTAPSGRPTGAASTTAPEASGGTATATATTSAPAGPRGQKPTGATRARTKRAPVTNKEWMERYAERGEARNAEARDKLVPLRPDERPWPILAGVVLCAAAGLLNLILWIVGAKIGGKEPSAFEMLAFAFIMGVCAVGMWVKWYQAVLAFMVLLGILILVFALLLVEVSNVKGFLLAIVIVVGGGYEFWKLVRVLARLQMPTRPTRSTDR